MDIRPFLNVPLHVTVWYKGKCKNCHSVIKEKIHDYGTLKYAELEKEMEKTDHPIVPFQCKQCGAENLPETLLYKDELRDLVIVESVIQYGHVIEGEQAQKMQQAQQERFQIFKEKEKEFWDLYTDTALANWRDFVNELADFEIKDAFSKLNIDSNATTVAQLRREVLRRIQSIEEKQRFWKIANEYFIYQHLLEIGPLGWAVEEDVKYYGHNRMRFIILHFPLDESFEQSRTEWIGKIIKKKRGDNDFLFRRISMLTDELDRTRKKITKYVHQIEELKAEKSQLQERLSKAYHDLQKEKEQRKKNIHTRKKQDIYKIRELKSFINELMDELKKKEQEIIRLKSSSEIHQEREFPVLDETDEQTSEKDTLEKLKGKTVAIIGGQRQKQASVNVYPCTILTHTGEQLDPEFYQALKQADIIVILTQFVSHIAMWEAKSFSIQKDKPIHFVKGLNIGKILYEVAK